MAFTQLFPRPLAFRPKSNSVSFLVRYAAGGPRRPPAEVSEVPPASVPFLSRRWPSSSPRSPSTCTRRCYSTKPRSSRSAQSARAGSPNREKQSPGAKQRLRRRAEDDQSSEFRFIERFKRVDFDRTAWLREAERKAQSDAWHVVTTSVQTPTAFEFDRQVLLPDFSPRSREQDVSRSAVAQAESRHVEAEEGEELLEQTRRGRQLSSPRSRAAAEGRTATSTHLASLEEGTACGTQERHTEPGGETGRDRTSPSEEDSVDALIADRALALKDMPPPPVTYFDHLTEFASETENARRATFSSTSKFPFLPGPPPPSRFFTKGKEDWRYQWRREDDEDLWKSPDSSLRRAVTGSQVDTTASARCDGFGFPDTFEEPRGLERKQLSVFLPSSQTWKPIAVLNSHQLLFALQHPQVSLHPSGRATPAEGCSPSAARVADAASLRSSSSDGFRQGYPLIYWRQLLSRLQRIAFSFDGASLFALIATLTRHIAAVRRELEAVQALASSTTFLSAEHQARGAAELRTADASRSRSFSSCRASGVSLSPASFGCGRATAASESGDKTGAEREFRSSSGEQEKNKEAIAKLRDRADELNSIFLALTQPGIWKQLSDDALPHLPFLSLPALSNLAETFALLSPKLSSSLNVVIMQAIDQVHGIGQPHLHYPAVDFDSSPSSPGEHTRGGFSDRRTPGAPAPATVQALFRLLDACAEALHVSSALASSLSQQLSTESASVHTPSFLARVLSYERFETCKAGSFAAAGVVGTLSHQLFETAVGQTKLASELLRLPLEDRVRLVVHASLYWQQDAVEPATRQFLNSAISSIFSNKGGLPKPTVPQLFALLGSALLPSLGGSFPPLERLDGFLHSDASFSSVFSPFGFSSCCSSPLPLFPCVSPLPLLAPLHGGDSEKPCKPLGLFSSLARLQSSPLLLSFFRIFVEERRKQEAATFPSRTTEEPFFSPPHFACLLECLDASLVLVPSSLVLSELSGAPPPASESVSYTSLASHRLYLPARSHAPPSAGFAEPLEEGDYAYLRDSCVDNSPSSLASSATERIPLRLSSVLSLQRCLGGELGTAFKLLEGLGCTYSVQRGDSGAATCSSAAAAEFDKQTFGSGDPLFVVPRLLSLFATSISQQLGRLSFPSLLHVLHSQTAALRFSAVFQLAVPDSLARDLPPGGECLSTQTDVASASSSDSSFSSEASPRATATSMSPQSAQEQIDCLAFSSSSFARRSRAWRTEMGACLAVQLLATASLLRRLSENLSLGLVSPVQAKALRSSQDTQANSDAFNAEKRSENVALSALFFEEKNVFAEDALHALLQNGLSAILCSVSTASAAIRDSLPALHAEEEKGEKETQKPNERDQLSSEAEAAAVAFGKEAFRCMRSIRRLFEGRPATFGSPRRDVVDLNDDLRRLSLEQQVSWLSTLLTLFEVRLHRQSWERQHEGESSHRRDLNGNLQPLQPSELLEESARVFLFLAGNLQHRAHLSSSDVFADEGEETSLSVVEVTAAFSRCVALALSSSSPSLNSLLSSSPATREGCTRAGTDLGVAGSDAEVSWLAGSLQLALDDVRDTLVHASSSQLRRVSAAAQALAEAQGEMRKRRFSPLRNPHDPPSAVRRVRGSEGDREEDESFCEQDALGRDTELFWEEILTGLMNLSTRGLAESPAGTTLLRVKI
ncbi:hypothetical protein TGRUB_251890 [Toxoplasma gondii RUB]|uniref:Uncharacterized protein n=1 Tax=Toxoplasma gondii RUB TaxID=935652 RepID=A0A086LLX2_TOXGO|nr:hypothetical protein TGRUB_251890 [Toxoplasma gondii RUB]